MNTIENLKATLGLASKKLADAVRIGLPLDDRNSALAEYFSAKKSLENAEKAEAAVASASAAVETAMAVVRDAEDALAAAYAAATPPGPVLHRVVTPPSVDTDTVVKDAVKAALAEARDDVLGGISNVVNETMVEVLRDFQAHAQDLVKAAMADAIAEEKISSAVEKDKFITALSESIEEAIKNAMNIQGPTPI